MIRLGLLVVLLASLVHAAESPPAHLPNELSAEAILDGAYPFPPSPLVAVGERVDGLDRSRLGAVPAPGVHPRLLFGPSQLPELRTRIANSAVGQALLGQLRARTGATIRKPGTWESQVFAHLVAGESEAALALYRVNQGTPSDKPGHYQPNPLYPLVLEAYDALLSDDRTRGELVAKAVVGYARMITPLLREAFAQPMHDDVFRIKVESVPSSPQNPAHGQMQVWSGPRDLVGYHLLGYAYDFAAPWMDAGQQAVVRDAIAQATFGKLWLGARLPHHFRNWNWCAVALSQPLLALAIEGEPGFDPRVYRLGVACARDYLTYGISPQGSSTEAVGYTQFGFVWANPFLVAATRRGDSLLTHSHFRAMLGWYLHAAEPWGRAWTSHGDGGDSGPSLGTALMWHHFFPGDAEATEVLRQVQPDPATIAKNRDHLIEMLTWVGDPLSTPAAPALQPTWFDAQRSSLIARAGTGADAAVLQFECRTDSVGASHEHADRGAFTFSALGRSWAKDYFRSVESRHHNVVTIDGKGQGYWPGPGRWLGQVDAGWAMLAACDAADAYRWQWPKTILTDPADSPRFAYPRWASYRTESQAWQATWAGIASEADDRPAVVAHWQGFADVAGGPRMWDEDGWPRRVPWNPVQRAFRTVAFARGAHPWLLVVDDVQKDAQERLYEWGMMTGANTEVVSIVGNDVILADATVARDSDGQPKPKPGTRLLLVRVLNRAAPALARERTTMPAIRLETYERKDALTADGRSFGMDRRLIIPSRATSPDFRILLLPFRQGDPLPQTTWDAGRQHLTIRVGTQQDDLDFSADADGRTRLTLTRNDLLVTLP